MLSILTATQGLLAAAEGPLSAAEANSEFILFIKHMAAAIVFATIGVAIFAGGFWAVTKILPFSLRKELEEDQNTAVAIIAGSMLIGISLIIAAAIQG